MLDVHALQVFCEAARSRSFTAAAHKLNMTQPAVSMQIKTLEDQLQIKLFERNGRSVQLTKAGQALLSRAARIVDLSIQTEEFMRAANEEVLGDLVIGCSLPSTHDILIHLAARFQQLYPLVRIRIPTVSNEELVDKIASGQFDFGMMNIVNYCDPVECLSLFQDRIILVAPAGYPFGHDDAVKPTDLLAHPFVCQGKHSACHYAVRDALSPHDIDISQFDVRMEIHNHRAIIAAVERGVGLSFVSQLDAQTALQRGTIRAIKIDEIDLSTDVGLAYSASHTTSVTGLKFKEFITHAHTHREVKRLIQVDDYYEVRKSYA